MIALLADHNIELWVVQALRRRGVDVLTALDDQSDRRSDADLLDRALAIGRVLVSHDRDFLRESHRRQLHGEDFAGVVFLPRRLAPKTALDDLELIAKVLNPREVRGFLYRLPL